MEAASPFVVRLAAFAALLGDESRERDVVIGIYVSRRTHRAWQKMFGLFVSIVPLRFSYDPGRPFRDWLVSTRDIVADAVTHAAIPYEHMHTELRSLGRVPPEINVIVLPSSDDEPILFAGITMRRVPTQSNRMPWGFTLKFEDAENAYMVRFDARLHDPTAVCAMLQRHQSLLEAIAEHPDESLAQLMAMSREQIRLPEGLQ